MRFTRGNKILAIIPEKRRQMYSSGENQAMGAGEVVYGPGEVVYGAGEVDYGAGVHGAEEVVSSEEEVVTIEEEVVSSEAESGFCEFEHLEFCSQLSSEVSFDFEYIDLTKEDSGEDVSEKSVCEFDHLDFANQLSLDEEFERDDLTQVDFAQVDSSQVDSTQVASTQADSTQVGFTQVDSTQADLRQVNLRQVDLRQVDSTHVDFRQVDSTRVDFRQVDSTEVDLTQNEADKGPLDDLFKENYDYNSNSFDFTGVDNTCYELLKQQPNTVGYSNDLVNQDSQDRLTLEPSENVLQNLLKTILFDTIFTDNVEQEIYFNENNFVQFNLNLNYNVNVPTDCSDHVEGEHEKPEKVIDVASPSATPNLVKFVYNLRPKKMLRKKTTFLESLSITISLKDGTYSARCNWSELDVQKYIKSLNENYLKTFEEIKPINSNGNNKRKRRCFVSIPCDVCGKVFNNKTNHKFHMKIHLGIRNIICQVCDMGFVRTTDLKQHLPKHTNERRFQCNDCGRMFKRKQALVNHSRGFHNGVHPYKCEFCPKKCINKDSLNRHIRADHTEEIYTCYRCKKTFNKKYLLEQHVNEHTEEIKYSCKICGQPFLSAHKLKLHYVKHKVPLLPRCIPCRFTFEKHGHLLQHIQQMHPYIARRKWFPCNRCNKMFIFGQTLNAHVKEFHPDTYKCQLCSQEFVLKENYIVHLDERHYQSDCKSFVASEKAFMKGVVTGKRTDVAKRKQGDVFCQICYRFYNNAVSFKRHCWRKHKVENNKATLT